MPPFIHSKFFIPPNSSLSHPHTPQPQSQPLSSLLNFKPRMLRFMLCLFLPIVYHFYFIANFLIPLFDLLHYLLFSLLIQALKSHTVLQFLYTVSIAKLFLFSTHVFLQFSTVVCKCSLLQSNRNYLYQSLGYHNPFS